MSVRRQRSWNCLARRGASTALLMAAAASMLPGTAPGAGASSTVTATVVSATSLDASACAPGVADVTSFGMVMPGTSTTTSADCTLVFGSTNDTAMLHAVQGDGHGVAMARLSSGPLDLEAAGDGDHFSTDGRLAQALSTGTGDDDLAAAAAMQRLGSNAGKLVTVGSAETGSSSSTAGSVIARWTSTGNLDTTFSAGDGTDGFEIVQLAAAATDDFRAVAIDASDRIVAVGNAGDSSYSVARFTADGALDASFSAGDGTDGYIKLGPTAGTDDLEAVVISPSGEIYATGAADTAAMVLKLRADGTPDPDFGVAGTATFSFGGTGFASAIQVLGDGRVVVAGRARISGDDEVAVARLLADGSGLDPAFGSTGVGRVDVDAANHDVAMDMDIGSNGAIYVAGRVDIGSDPQGVLARFTSGGVLDTTFSAGDGSNGWLQESIGTRTDFTSVVAHEGGSVAVAGRGRDAGGDDDMLVVRYLAGGGRDDGFGSNGVALLDHSGSTRAHALVVGPDSKYVVVGDGARNHGIARMESVRVPDFAVTTNDWGSAASLFGACLEGVGGGAAAAWPDSADCTARTNADWRAVSAQLGTSSKVATTAAPTTSATADIRFGLKAASNQPPGTYVAPIRFQVVAPNA